MHALTSSAATSASPLGCVVDQEGVKRQTVWQDEVADVVAADAQSIQLHGVTVFQGHLHRLQMRVHAHIHTLKSNYGNSINYNKYMF